ncbi:MAG: serine/threonine-protein kinase [Kofleriaceae bacterium]
MTEGAPIGPTKLGRYELITQLGQGGMAEVQLALQRGPAGFEKLVVIKLVHGHLATQKQFVDMLLDEARLAALVKHPNVVDIYDLGEDNGRFFIAMEYLEGEPLLGLLRAGRDGNRLDALSTARLIADTAEGLDAAHELRSLAGDPMELVHHDVSLGNIVVLYNGQVKLVDFGVAKATQKAGPHVQVHGKFGYMAPEKLRGKPGDRRSDIWSLGVVLWEALTLKRLFRGGTENETIRQVLELKLQPPSAISAEAPTELDAIVMRALQRDPERRYPNAKELAQDIEEVLRKLQYGGRNDQIAKYMQATFEHHILARKKLLQEVSSKGEASSEVIDALFSQPAFINDSPPGGGARGSGIRASGDFSISFKRPTTNTPRPPSAFDPEPREKPSPVDIIERRRSISDHMLAEGTPHLPRGQTNRFAEATPNFTDPDLSIEVEIMEPVAPAPRKRFDTALDPALVKPYRSGVIEPDPEPSRVTLRPVSEIAAHADATLDMAELLDAPSGPVAMPLPKRRSEPVIRKTPVPPPDDDNDDAATVLRLDPLDLDDQPVVAIEAEATRPETSPSVVVSDDEIPVEVEVEAKPAEDAAVPGLKRKLWPIVVVLVFVLAGGLTTLVVLNP